MTLVGSYLYAGTSSGGFYIFDVHDPVHPDVIGHLDMESTAHGVVVSGTYAYVADGEVGLQVVDVSEAMTPTAVYTLDTPGTAYGVVISGMYAYIADGEAGLQVVDVSDVVSPTIIETVDTPEISYDIAVQRGNVYLADGPGGVVEVINLCERKVFPLTGKKYINPGLWYFDGFTDEKSGWPIYYWKDNIDWHYVDGEYEMRLLAPRRTAKADAPYRIPAGRPYRVDVDAHVAPTTALPSLYGLVFDGDENGGFYTFLINPERRTFLVWQWQDTWKVIVEEQSAENVIKEPRQRYHLTVVRDVDAIHFFINEVKVKEVHITHSLSQTAGVGLLAISESEAPAAARFDNFAVWKP